MRTINILIIGLAIVLSSCSSKNDSAQKVCDCFDQVHTISAMADDQKEVDLIVDSCTRLYMSTLKSLEGDSDKKDAFEKAYRNCQEK